MSTPARPTNPPSMEPTMTTEPLSVDELRAAADVLERTEMSYTGADDRPREKGWAFRAADLHAEADRLEAEAAAAKVAEEQLIEALAEALCDAQGECGWIFSNEWRTTSKQDDWRSLVRAFLAKPEFAITRQVAK